jgi:hypothetical protein
MCCEKQQESSEKAGVSEAPYQHMLKMRQENNDEA